jgi:hypothetical protein
MNEEEEQMQTRQHLEPRNVCCVQHLPPLRVRVVRRHGDDDVGVGAANLPGEGRQRSEVAGRRRRGGLPVGIVLEVGEEHAEDCKGDDVTQTVRAGGLGWRFTGHDKDCQGVLP